MAIDTEAKRLSCLDHDWMLSEAVPIPAAGVSAFDRYHCLWSYTGIAAPIVFSGLLDVTVRKRFDALDVQGRGHVDIRDRFGNLMVKRHGG